MGFCNCRVVESILAIIIVVFAYWQSSWSQWMIIIAAVLLLIHANFCKSCKACTPMSAPKSGGKSKKR